MSKYLTKKYLNQPRMAAYVEQFKYVEDGDSVLEIGNAGGIFEEMASKITKYTSADVDPQSDPDLILNLATIDDESKKIMGKFSKVFCCEVLEHISFDKFKESFGNLLDLSEGLVIVSIPDNRRYARLSFGFGTSLLKKVFSIPFSGKVVNIKNHEEHHFEIHSANYKNILNAFSKVSTDRDFKMIKNYRCYDRPYQHFFIFQKK